MTASANRLSLGQPQRLPILVMLIVISAITAVGIATYLSVKNSIAARADENLAAIGMLKVAQIQDWLEERRDDVRFLTNSPPFSVNFQRWLQSGMRDERIKELLVRRLQELSAHHHYRHIAVHSAADGALLLAVGNGHADSQHARSQARNAVQSRALLLDDLHFAPDSAPPAIELGYFSPVSGAANSPPLAVAHLAADPTDQLFPLLQKWPGSSSSAETLLVRVEGDKLIYLNELRHRPNSALQFQMPLSVVDLLAAQAARGKSGTIRGVDYREVPSLGYALPVPGTPWLLIAKIDEAEVYANFDKMVLFSTIVIALLLLGGIWWVAQRQQLAAETARHLAEIEDLYQNAPCGYHSIDADGRIVRINDTELRWLGYAREEVVNRMHIYDLMTEKDLPEFHASFVNLKDLGEVKELEREMVRKDGSIMPASLTASAVTDQNGHYLYSRTTMFDMTHIKKIEKEREEQASRVRFLSRRLVTAQEEERRRLVNELLDTASPNLSAIQVILNSMNTSLAAGKAMPKFDASLEDALALLADTGRSIREMCSELRPPLLDYSGLIPALDGYVKQFVRRTGMAVHFNPRGKPTRFSHEVESSLFRIVQEALANCAKHANTSGIEIELAVTESCVRLIVTDNGADFGPATLGEPGCTPGHGLIAMREHAEFIGGSFEFMSEPCGGTKISITLASTQPDPEALAENSAPI